MRIDEFIPDNVKNMLKLDQSNQVDSNNNKSGNENDKVDFGGVLEKQLSAVNDKQVDAEQTSQQFVDGDDIDVHKAMLSTQEAKLSLELAIQVRNKLVEAYQELNKMQI